MTTTTDGAIYARVHDVPEDIDPDTGVSMEPAVEIEIDVVVGEDVRCLTTYVPRSWSDTEVRQAVNDTAHSVCESLGLPDLDVKLIAYRHSADLAKEGK